MSNFELFETSFIMTVITLFSKVNFLSTYEFLSEFNKSCQAIKRFSCFKGQYKSLSLIQSSKISLQFKITWN